MNPNLQHKLQPPCRLSQANERHLSLTPCGGCQSNHTPKEKEEWAGPAQTPNKGILPLHTYIFSVMLLRIPADLGV
ncbi:hypothetical protein QQF64_021349 [Cirrhinus molitorella]|uniref:Uncharacterized protein n=1 Tax=Cirrhinus molitorella TaxID=172907 RepID=A0ABR3LF80_9TELE